MTTELDLAAIDRERERIRSTYLLAERPPSSARGLHHFALLCSDVERTVKFYQEVLEFPLTEIFENRDYKGSNHFLSRGLGVGHAPSLPAPCPRWLVDRKAPADLPATRPSCGAPSPPTETWTASSASARAG